MAFSLLQIMVGLGALLASQAMMALFVCAGFFGSAWFGKFAISRACAKLGAAILISTLVLEWVVFQVICKPPFGWWSVAFNSLLALVLWCYLKTAFEDPGTPNSSEWQTWKSQIDFKGLIMSPDDEILKKKKRLGTWGSLLLQGLRLYAPGAGSPLQTLRHLCASHGSPLSPDWQLCWLAKPQELLAPPVVSVLVLPVLPLLSQWSW
mmetsp:Transcript_16754/g.30940  ORF Transcript_16754/g.30940 Transcript_16754/m.30940 type:complete len:207 (-) Transcript_16754:402-1022(-)